MTREAGGSLITQERKGYHHLSRIYPDLAAGLSSTREEKYSRAISETSQLYDPRISSLFDLGNAADEYDVSRRYLPIVVSVGGESRDRLCFRMIKQNTVSLKGENPVSVRVPAVGGKDVVEWIGPGSPVRQVSFARVIEGRSTWMAARFPQSTTVFRPIYHGTPRFTHVGGNSLSSSPMFIYSRFDMNALLEISASQTGGFDHADVTFNPWYQQQVAIVDEAGNWSIWELSGQQRQHFNSNWVADCVKSGWLPWPGFGDSVNPPGHPRHDGWARVEWVTDFSTLVVSDRRCIMVYRMQDGQIISYEIELGFARKSEWILDIKRSSYDPSHLFVLTSSDVFWVNLSSSVFLSAEEEERSSLFPRLSWRHFRDWEDTTLQLSPLLVGEEFYLILHSRINHLAQLFQIPVSSTGDVLPIPDPSLLDMPNVLEHEHTSSGSRAPGDTARLINIESREVSYSTGGRDQATPRFRLVKLFMFDSHLALHESLYIAPRDNYHEDEGEEEEHEERQLLRGTKRNTKRRLHSGRSKMTVYDNDFVVDDWDESVVEPEEKLLSRSRPIWTRPSVPKTLEFPWTVDFNPIYQVAIGRLRPSSLSKNGTSHGWRGENSFDGLFRELQAKGIPGRVLDTRFKCRTMYVAE